METRVEPSGAHRTITGLPSDPPGSYFFDWSVPAPEGEWEYRLDEFAHYGPGWWPLYAYYPPAGRFPECYLTKVVRICPDTENPAWGSEAVVLRPHRATDLAIVTATLHLCVRPHEVGVIAVDTDITVDLRAKTFTVAEGCPQSVLGQAETKAARILRLLRHHRSRRRAGFVHSEAEHTGHQPHPS